MAEPTPRPWEFGINPNPMGPHNEVVVRPAGQFPHGDWVADCGSQHDPERIANGALIVRAVNAHDDLVKAMGDVLACLKEMKGWASRVSDELIEGEGAGERYSTAFDRSDEATEKARAALAKAGVT